MYRLLLSLSIIAGAGLLPAADAPAPSRKDNTIVLDEMALKNLGIEPEEAEERDFEETKLVLGTIEVLPGKSAVVSTRIPGRVKSVLALPDMHCSAGDEMLWVESRQPGDPPPVVRVEAPISGIIAKVNVAEGQPVSPEDSLIEIYDPAVVEGRAMVPQYLAARLNKGMEARFRIPGYQDRGWTAQLAHTGAVADARSGTIEAAFHIPNEDGALRPGMRAEIILVLSKTPGVQSVPREAVQGDTLHRFIFKRDYELPTAFVKTPVVTGRENDRFIEITEGLLPGDEIVVKGAYALAFAGQGTSSLKEALDAAHGHPHNEDGTEMTKAQQAAADAGKNEAGAAGDRGGALIWQITSGALLVLLILSAAQRRTPAKAAQPETI